MEKIKRLIAAGASIPTAIKEVLGRPIAVFAEEYGRNRSIMNGVVNGTRAPTEDDIKALVTELGGTREEWRQLLWQAGKPAASTAVPSRKGG